MNSIAAANKPPQAPGAVAACLALAVLLLALATPGEKSSLVLSAATALILSALIALKPSVRIGNVSSIVGLSMIGALLLAAAPASATTPAFWLALIGLGVLAAIGVQRTAALDGNAFVGPVTAALFGLWLVYFWQMLVTAFGVPKVLLPAPSMIVQSIAGHAPTLAGDFMQTVLKSVLSGWLIGSGLGFFVGVAIDRLPFLQRGLLPIAALTSTVPLVAVAPIAVMWFGFDWPSKAAVVVLMTFFPMLVATLAGLKAAGRLERELMHSYAAGYFRTLVDLRLPCALPFLFGAFKVNASLALIGAIVAEFFGSPTAGLGFRISTEAAKMNMGLVWGAIVVAAVTGSLVYTSLVQLERRFAFWHPSVRGA